MEKVLILDFGSQYTRLIAKAIRELEVYCEVVPSEIGSGEIERERRRGHVKGLVLSGGPRSVYEKDAPKLDPQIYHLKIPILGICYGMQLLAKDFGGEVHKTQGEYGLSTMRILKRDKLFRGLNKEEQVWMSHGDSIEKLPPDFINLAQGLQAHVSGGKPPFVAMRSADGLIYGLQFHPEVHHTSCGKQILRNWLFEICKAKERWRPGNLLGEKIRELRATLKDKNCLIAVSGGVDSSTAAVLVHRAIGDRLIPVFVDTGLLRAGESQRVQKVFEQLGIRLRVVEARERFLAALQGVIDPEEKRKRVGAEFIRVFEEEARRLERGVGKIDVLVQGTIYSDVIESGGSRGPDSMRFAASAAERIKSHHNVGGLPQMLNFEIVEPLRMFFKDEVRVLAKRLGIPAEITWEQPFPGPGLAVRILGEVTKERINTLQHIDRIMREEIQRAGLKAKVWQYFPVLLPIRSVAIMGDGRGYGQVVALRAVHSVDGMTADWAKIPYEILERISGRITNEVSGVTRVVYDITSKPPGTIEWE